MQHLCVNSCMLPQTQDLFSFLGDRCTRRSKSGAAAGNVAATTGSHFDQVTGWLVLDSCRCKLALEVRCICYAGSSRCSPVPCCLVLAPRGACLCQFCYGFVPTCAQFLISELCMCCCRGNYRSSYRGGSRGGYRGGRGRGPPQQAGPQ